MADPIITLTTDFGTASPFVASIKGIILGINANARIVDLTHEIPPFNLRHVSFFLAEALPCFPPHTIHVVVVDPEVGTQRSVLCVHVAHQRLLVPDNGCWSLLAACHPTQPVKVVKVSEPRFHRANVSPTFHGRDIFAPVAGYLSLGINQAELGPAITQWRKLPWPVAGRVADGVRGEIIFVDHFGNLISNISPKCLAEAGDRPLRVTIADFPVPRKVRAYAEAKKGDVVSLFSSSGLLEVAVVQGNASKHLNLNVGAPMLVEWGERRSTAPLPASSAMLPSS
jgi:S-adenosylmethionine hydrolase